MIYLVTKQDLHSKSSVNISVEESLRLLDQIHYVGVDTETDGLDCHTNKLLSLQLGCYNFQVVIDCTTIDILRYKAYLESDRVFLFWNALFDLKWLYKYRIIPNNVYDGFLAEKLLFLGYPAGIHQMSLKAACHDYLNVDLDKTVRGQIIYKGIRSEEVIIYAANDVKYLEQIRVKQFDELAEKDLLTAIKYENRFVSVLAYVEYCGVKLNVDKWKEKNKTDIDKLNVLLEKLNTWLLEHEPESEYVRVNKQGNLFTGYDLKPQVLINWNSVQQVGKLLKKYGVTIQSKDGESIEAKVLIPQKDKCDLIPIYLEYKEAQKVVSTYGATFIEQVNKSTGRLYTHYTQLGADTTRVTSGGKDKKHNYINFLNLPSDANTRSCFVAEDGNRWISIDYSGQETYLLASIANDKALIKELTTGSKDVHSLTAYMAYKQIPRETPIKDIKKKYHDLRAEAKGIEFTINYGGDANTIAVNKNLPLEEAQKIYDAYMKGFKGIKKYQDYRRKEVMDKGYILLNPLTGHKAFVYDFQELKDLKKQFNSEFWEKYRQLKRENAHNELVESVKHYFKRKAACEKQSINYPIQGTGSMCLRVSLIKFFTYLKKNNLLFKVLITIIPYDEVNCEAPADVAEEVAEKLYNCMIEAGKYFCDKCKLDAEISRLPDGTLPTYWIH